MRMHWFKTFFRSTTELKVTTPTPNEIEQNYSTGNCTEYLVRPIDWDAIVLEHPGLDDEMLQKFANEFPDIIPACHEKRTWFENMLAVTDWVTRNYATITVENRTAIINYFNHYAVSMAPVYGKKKSIHLGLSIWNGLGCENIMLMAITAITVLGHLLEN